MAKIVTPTPSDSPVGQSKKGAAQAVASIPFARSSKWHIEQSGTATNVAINVANPGTLTFPLASYGYLSAVLISVVAAGGVGTPTAAVAYEDAPWSLFSSIQLNDVNGVPIFQLSGYSAFLAAKFGGYRLFGPDLSTFTYSAVAATGNFKFLLPIYLEFGRDGLGSLPNMDASARYQLQLTLASGIASATGPIYTTAPTTSPTVSVTVEVLCRSQPPATDMYGNQNSVTPPSPGTVQYWTSQTFSAQANGANTLQLSRVGNLIRNHILIWRNTNGTRATAETGGDVPVTFEFDWDAGIRYQANTATLRDILFLGAGYDCPAGVLVLPNTQDPDHINLSEYGDEWLPTVGASKLTLRYTTTAGAGSLAVVTNDIVPASGQVYAAPALSEGY